MAPAKRGVIINANPWSTKLKPHTWMTDERTYKPIVAASDMTISRKIAFEKRPLNDVPLFFSLDTASTPLTARNNAAN